MEDRYPYPSYDIPYDDIVLTIRENGYRDVMVQVPEGLKRGAASLAEKIQKNTDATIWIDGEPCYGACDHAGEKVAVLDMDAVIHLGHSSIPSMDMSHSVPVHFYPVRLIEDMSRMMKGIEGHLDGLNISTIGLATTVQHISLIGPVTDLIEGRDINVLIGPPGSREQYSGQVLGCSFHTAREITDAVDGYLFMGTGRFHALGLYLSVRKPVWMVDPSSGSVSVIEQKELDLFLKKRFAAISHAKDLLSEGERLGIILGNKPGQRRMDLARYMAKVVADSGYRSSLVNMEHLDPMKIRSLGFKLVCSTACPRIAVDDSGKYILEGVTLLTPQELRIALDLDDWENYRLDEEW